MSTNIVVHIILSPEAQLHNMFSFDLLYGDFKSIIPQMIFFHIMVPSNMIRLAQSTAH